MGTTKEDIREWFREAKKHKATHLLVVCDTFEYTDYPIEVLEGEKIEKVIKDFSKNMQKVIEVYNIKIDMEKQLSQDRVWNT
jgi:hypothetical protein